jgi:acetyltransferase
MLPSPSPDIDGVTLRPASAADAPAIQALVRSLRPHTRYLRFFNGVQELSPAWLERFTRADPEGDFSLVAIAPGTGAIVAMAQYAVDPAVDPSSTRADVAVVVADDWQGAGIGTQLLRRLLSIASAAGIERLEAEVLAENRTMLALLNAMGFRVRRHAGSALFHHASIALVTQPAGAETRGSSRRPTLVSAPPT